MQRITANILNCPSCRQSYRLEEVDGDRARVFSGYLVCQSCSSAVPICHGFPLFPQMRPYDDAPGRERMEALEDELFGDLSRYFRFLAVKKLRPLYDAYALFQPFNESTRAIYPLIDLLRDAVKPGDLILDTWGRSGWSGEIIAGLFPEQHVISIWEGDSNVLGYKGYRHWLSEHARAPNLDIIFTSANQPLPFASNSFAIIHGLDSLHRYSSPPFIPECLRVNNNDGVLIFPHVHLSNNEPNPFFDRGGTHRHGTEYQKDFDRLISGTKRSVFVLSEADLFESGEKFVLRSTPDTPHYNGLVLIADQKWQDKALKQPPLARDADEAFPIINPMLSIDLNRGSIVLDGSRLSDGVAHILYRHPIYEKRIQSLNGKALTDEECRFLYWAGRPLKIKEIAERMGIGLDRAHEITDKLAAEEVVMALSVSPAMRRLQHFYHNQSLAYAPSENHFRRLWQDAASLYDKQPLLISAEDGSEFSYQNADTLVTAIAAYLNACGLVAGDRILICSDNHPEYAFTTWAAWLLGLVVIPIDPAIAKKVLNGIVERSGPKQFFCDTARLSLLQDWHPVIFDPLSESGNPLAHSFSELIEPHIDGDVAPQVELRSETPAVILFTSGSTGTPKGVVLSQGAICRSGALLVQAYQWQIGEVLYSLGGFHAMSGLRNPLSAALHGGCSILVAGHSWRDQVIAVSELCAQWKVNVISAVPALLTRLIAQRERLAADDLRSLRLILVTGARLSEEVAVETERWLNVPVCNYYGLTETCGICAYVPISCSRAGKSVIGKPLGALLQVIGDDGRPVATGEVGEIRVYSDNLMLGYDHDSKRTSEVLQDGWYDTGDLGQFRDDGQLELLGRRDNQIKDKTGAIVHPELIEQMLLADPNILEASVCGFTDDMNDTKLAAFVVGSGKKDSASLIDWLKKLITAEYGADRVPERFFVVGELPRNSNGKVNTKALITQVHSENESNQYDRQQPI